MTTEPSVPPARQDASAWRNTEIVRHGRILAGCLLGIGCGVSSLWFYSLGLFLKPLAQEFGWGRAAASAGPLVGILALGMVSPLVGSVIDRVGPRRIAALSLLGLAAGFALLGLGTQGLTSFLLLTCVLAALAAGSSPISFSRVLVTTFHQQRGLALGIAITGAGIGAILAPLAVAQMLAAWGWRQSYLALSCGVLLITPLVYLLTGPRASAVAAPITPSQVVFEDGPVFRTAQFARLGLIFILCSLAVFGTVVHLVPMLTDRGLGAVQAASFASAVGVTVIAGRLLTGVLLDRYDASRLGATLFLVSSAGMWLLYVGGPALTVIGALLAGFAIGAEMDLAAYLVSKNFSPQRYSTAFGGIYACVSVGGGLGPLLAGMAYDHTGSYSLWLASAALALLSAAALISLWKVPQTSLARVLS